MDWFEATLAIAYAAGVLGIVVGSMMLIATLVRLRGDPTKLSSIICRQCGYELPEPSNQTAACPECGLSPERAKGFVSIRPPRAMFLFMFIPGVLVAILHVSGLLGHHAYRHIHQSPYADFYWMFSAIMTCGLFAGCARLASSVVSPGTARRPCRRPFCITFGIAIVASQGFVLFGSIGSDGSWYGPGLMASVGVLIPTGIAVIVAAIAGMLTLWQHTYRGAH